MKDHPILAPLKALRELVDMIRHETIDTPHIDMGKPYNLNTMVDAARTLNHYDQTDNPWPPGAVRDLRQSLGLTQAELAIALGDISPTTIHNLERGNHAPSRKTIAKLNAFVQRQEK